MIKNQNNNTEFFEDKLNNKSGFIERHGLLAAFIGAVAVIIGAIITIVYN